jgi:hypothetical protein
VSDALPWLSPRQWEPVTAPITNGSDNRSPAALRAVVEQFDVVGQPRYAETAKATYCNIFVWDVTRALACEVPHWQYGGVELNANAMIRWLAKESKPHSWHPLTRDQAIAYASEGKPAVVGWVNAKGGPGHIAIVMPDDGAGGLWLAQAGGTNDTRLSFSQAFGTHGPVYFFGHT